MEEKFKEFVAGLDRKSLQKLADILDSWMDIPEDFSVVNALRSIVDTVDSARDYVSTVLDEMRARHDP